MGISDDLVGTRLPPVSYGWGPDDAILYALGVGARPPLELDLLYEGRGPEVLPTFALIPSWFAMRDVRSILDTGSAPMVHAAQSLDLLRAMPPKGEVRVEAEVAAVWDKGKSSLIEIEATGSDVAGELFRSRSSTMVLGVGGWGGDRGPTSNVTELPGEPTQVHEDVVRPEQSAIYRLSGDKNPLHIDPQAAQHAGFEDVFLHGLCTMGFAARALIATCGNGEPAALRTIGCRFAKPVMLDRPLVTDIWDHGGGEVSFRTRQDDVVALSGVTATLTR